MDEEMVVAILAFVVIGVPALGFTARFALKPIVEAIIRLRDAFAPQSATPTGMQERRLVAIEEELSAIRVQLERLEGTAFAKELRSSPRGAEEHRVGPGAHQTG
jgi:hypothetical protein